MYALCIYKDESAYAACMLQQLVEHLLAMAW